MTLTKEVDIKSDINEFNILIDNFCPFDFENIGTAINSVHIAAGGSSVSDMVVCVMLADNTAKCFGESQVSFNTRIFY